MRPNSELRRCYDRLEPDDPARPLIDLAMENDSPEVLAAVIRRLLAEIRAERGDVKEPTNRL